LKRIFTALPESWRTGLFLFLATLLLAVPQAAGLPLLDRDEPRFAEASREMLESGNFIVPTFNHEPRYAKPPLIYWAQAAAFTLFGENAFAARLPSLLATAGTAVLLFAWGASLGEASVGLLAALAYALCLQVMQQGRVATADALLIFFTTLTAFAGWKMLTLMKTGHGSWNAWGLVLAIFLLGLLIVSGWAIPAYVETQGAYWREGLGHDVGDRMVSGFQGHGASSLGWYLLGLPLYFLLFWLSALPWSPLLVIQRRRLFAAWRPDETDRCLLFNAALFFIIFSLMVTKLPHYTLPAFPFLALLFARRWVSAGLSPRWPVIGMVGWGAAWAIAGLVVPGRFPSPAGELVRAAGNALTPQTKWALVDFQEPSTVWEMRRVVSGYAQVIPSDAVKVFLLQPGPRAVVMTSGAAVLRPVIDPNPARRLFEARGWNAAKGVSIDLTLVIKKE